MKNGRKKEKVGKQNIKKEKETKGEKMKDR